MAEKLTVLIPCKNEERNIRPCIESVKSIADELLVADSGSTDRTMKIARELGARIIEREYVNSANFKNWAIPQAEHSWVLVVDADERLTPALAGEICSILSGSPACDAYRIFRRSFFLGHPVAHCGWNRDSVIRLFRLDVCCYEEKHVHAGLRVKTGRVDRLRGKLEHYTYWSFDQYFEKFGRYTTWGAEDLCARGRRTGLLSLSFRPAWRFFQHYVLQRGFLEGKRGFIISALGAFSVFTRYAKLWGIREGLPQPDPEAGRPESPG
jgi:glycosyltransferase involved in cell wall biosynthesis